MSTPLPAARPIENCPENAEKSASSGNDNQAASHEGGIETAAPDDVNTTVIELASGKTVTIRPRISVKAQGGPSQKGYRKYPGRDDYVLVKPPGNRRTNAECSATIWVRTQRQSG